MMENVTENNRLIAEFMGREFFAYNGNRSYNTPFKTYKECDDFIKEHNLEGYKPEIGWEQECGDYHNSWNWLMPVVEKIESLGYWTEIHGGVQCTTIIGKQNTSLDIIVEDDKKYTKIQSAYFAIVRFISWYNDNQNPQPNESN